MSITFEKAFSLLDQASAVLFGPSLTCPRLNYVEGDNAKNDIFLELEDADGHMVAFCKSDNLMVEIENGQMVLTDISGESVGVIVLMAIHLM